MEFYQRYSDETISDYEFVRFFQDVWGVTSEHMKSTNQDSVIQKFHQHVDNEKALARKKQLLASVEVCES